APDVLAALERAASAFGNAYDGLGIEALKRDVRALLGGAGNLEDLRGRLDSADPFHFARPVGGAGSAARATTARPSAVPVSGEARESFGPVVAKESA
ncbi:MAG: hypothetical protein ACREM2_05220, partial [Vulcanimicrobiaceae bacterium]